MGKHSCDYCSWVLCTVARECSLYLYTPPFTGDGDTSHRKAAPGLCMKESVWATDHPKQWSRRRRRRSQTDNPKAKQAWGITYIVWLQTLNIKHIPISWFNREGILCNIICKLCKHTRAQAAWEADTVTLVWYIAASIEHNVLVGVRTQSANYLRVCTHWPTIKYTCGCAYPKCQPSMCVYALTNK